jgi:hypothetical protein
MLLSGNVTVHLVLLVDGDAVLEGGLHGCQLGHVVLQQQLVLRFLLLVPGVLDGPPV